MASIAFLATHVLITLGIVTGTVLLLRAAGHVGEMGQPAIAGTAATAVAVAAGILTLTTGSN